MIIRLTVLWLWTAACVCLLGTQVSCANTDEPIVMQLGATLLWVQETLSRSPADRGSFIEFCPWDQIRISAIKSVQFRAYTKVNVRRRCSPLPTYFGHLLKNNDRLCRHNVTVIPTNVVYRPIAL